VSGETRRRWRGRLAQTALVALGVVPAAVIIWRAIHDQLGANPVEALEHRLGDWTIWLLLATLAITPIRRLTRWNGITRFRRTIGLLAFGYLCLHFLTYLVIDQGFPMQGFAIRYVAKDIAKRPYVTVGFTAFLMLMPLAWTSTKASIRRLGRRWTTLHQLIYPAAALGVLHYLWLVKADRSKPITLGLILVALLAIRVWTERRRAVRRPAQPGPGAAPERVALSGAP